jgi:DUF4097 and DUF4098 domain-containing protein YvlB
MSRFDENSEAGCGSRAGLSGFLRSLLDGIPWSETAKVDERIEVDAPQGRIVTLHNPNGRTQVVGEDRETLSIEVSKSARAENDTAALQLLNDIKVSTHDSSEGMHIDVDVPQKWNRHGNVDLQVRVPRDLEIRVSSANGKLCLRGLRCDVQAHSSNGSIRIADVIGDIDVSTANAKVSCSCTTGRLVARSSNGKIEVGEHSGSLDATTSNGLIRAQLEQLTNEGVNLATSNGRILLELPTEPDAEVDIRVDNGVIRSELALGQEKTEGAGRLRGRVGRGGAPIKLRTSNGTISLK